MQPDHLRILELRDRIRVDPAPFVFAQLAEEYRRAHDFDEAVDCCRECVARYPAYLSVRVILGRALAERGELDAAVAEFEQVLAAAPDSLTATRDLAEIELRLGRLDRALEHYRRALALFRGDVELEERVRALTRELTGAAAEQGPASSTAATGIERELAGLAAPSASVNFDELLTAMGAKDQSLPPLMEMLLAPAERREAPAPPPAAPAERPPTPWIATVAGLERWLAAIERRRAGRPASDRHANRSA